MLSWYRILFIILAITLIMFSGINAQQPADGENEFRLAAVNPRTHTMDTLTNDAGRGVHAVHDPDLDADGKPEVLITEYTHGGRVFAYEFAGDDKLQLIWASKKLDHPNDGQTPRSVSSGDFDNNGRQEIIFTVGYFANDSATQSIRGIYFYEYTGEDDDFGTEPAYILTLEAIDSAFAGINAGGRDENGYLIGDIDNDGKTELVFTPRQFTLPVAKAYILEVESGTFSGGDAVIKIEYTYETMGTFMGTNAIGFVPMSAALGDVDSDELDEIIIGGWANIGTGIAVGFIQIDGPDSYRPGSIIEVWDVGTCCVKYLPEFINVPGQGPAVYLHRTVTGIEDKMWVVDGIISDDFVSPGNLTEIFTNLGVYGIMDIGDQDHPTESEGDGFDIYLSEGPIIYDIEYDGSGLLASGESYSVKEIFDLRDYYDNHGGLFDDIYAVEGMDLDDDGRRDFIASYKGSSDPSLDTLNGIQISRDGFYIWFFEWGDSSAAISLDSVYTGLKGTILGIVMPDDFELQQNYPNPFNPSTTIAFRLPINKRISLKVYNALGQEIRTLIDQKEYTAGLHTLEWDGLDNTGNQVASGTYIYQLRYGNFSLSKKMTILC